MAEERHIGIPDEPLDYSSDFITKPYELDNVKKYEDQKHEVLGNEIKRTVVGENWKIPSEIKERRPQAVQALEGLERGVSDIIKGFFPQEQIKWRTDPVGAALGWATAIKAPVVVAGSALLEGAEKMFPETFAALKPKESKELTREKLEQVWEDTLQQESQKLEKARADLESGKISQVQYDAMQKQFDTLVGRRQKTFENMDKYNATVQALDGTAYPNAKVADAVVSESARYLQMRELNNAIEMAQRGIDPESTGFKIGNLAGPTAVLGLIGFGGNYLSRYGLSGALRRIASDVETEGGAARLAAIKPVRSRRQAAKAGALAVEVGTEEMESAQYVWENVQDYIERTGDKTLENFTPYDAKTFSASAYGAIAGKIETMGGIENIAAGAFRRLGVGGFGRRVLATGGEEAFEEGAQNLTEYLSRRIDGTTDKTIGEALEEALNSAAWGGFMGIGFGTIGGVTYRNARKQGIKILQDYGLSRETAEKVFDNMIEQTTDAISPRNEPVRENIRKKVALIYENADLSPAELEDTIEATTDLEMAMIARDAAERGIDIADHPLLDSTVNEIGWFRGGIPEQVADQVAALNNEIAGLREQLRQENAKEQKDFDKIEDLEAKIEQFYAKLPKEISDLVETDRQKVRQMLAAQSAELQTRQARRKLVRQVQQRAMNALQKAEESDVKQALRRLEQETKTEEKKAKEEERKQRTEQRKLRKAIEKVRQNIAKRKVGLPVDETLFEDADLVYKALKDSGFTDQQIAQMAEEDIVKTVAPYNISPITAEEQERAVEQAADVADGTITTGTPEPVAENVIQDYGEKIEGAKKDLVGKGVSAETLTDIDKIMKKAPKSETSKQILRNWLEQQDPAFVAQIRQLNLPIRVYKTLEYRRVLEEAFTQHPELNQEADRYSVLAGNEELPKETLDKYGIIPEYDFYYKTTDDHYVKLTPENVSARIEGRGALQFSYSKSTRGTYFLWAKKGSGSWIPLIEFDSMEEMDEHRNSHTQEDREKIYQEMTSFKDNRKEKVIRERVGTDYRNGKNVTEEQFAKQFGFRGVQFGNYENQEKRQREINNSYDSFMDLAKILNLPPKAISLGGTLGIAFGARGSGSALAHYEPDLKVINITRDAGAGALAHEWFHALDNYLAQNLSQYANMAGGGFLTKADNYYYYRVNEELADSMKEYLKAIKGEKNFQLRLRQLGQYWKRDWEVAARLFEQYVSTKVAEQNGINDYLASPQKYYISSSPYLKLDEAERVFPKLENMLKSIKTREEDGNVVLYQEQVDLADENARLDDIYPAYEGETIEVDGKERTVYNSNGDRIAKSKEALTNFWRWFGDSKVVDEQGRPLVVYHGTDADFDTFDRWKRGKNTQVSTHGFYFTDSTAVAETYGTKKMPVYLKMNNPYVIDYLGAFHTGLLPKGTVAVALKDNYNAMLKGNYDVKVLPYEEAVKFVEENEGYTITNFPFWNTGEMSQFAQENGYDGVIFNNIRDAVSEENIVSNVFSVFEPTQIKSVDNRGTYSEKTGNIYYQDNISLRDRAIEPRWAIPKVRGGWTKEKVLKYLKSVDSYSGAGTAAREISNFDSVEDFKNHIFYHGARYGTSGGMQPSIVMSDKKVERVGGGGYGEKYWAISLTKSKKVAGNIATAMGDGRIYPVLLVKNAKVIEMPELQDSADLDDHIVDLYEKGVDAVWIGDKNAGEQELAVINPKAIINIGNPDFYNAFGFGTEKNPIRTKTDEDFRKIFEFAKEYRNKDKETRLQEARNTVYWQTVNQSKKRGFYSPELRLVSLLQAADPSSLSHELAHDWMQQFFRWYRSGKASESFMQSWGALEKALGISPDDINVPEKASEAFARAYEAWVMTKTDWEKGIDIDDENRDKIIELFKRYQGYLTDIYEDLNNPYFIETWGETGKLKPELQAWFDNMTLQTDLIAARVATGAITPQQAQAEITARNVNQVVTAAEDNFTEKEKEEIAAVERMNDTSRYEVKGGNKNSLQNRLSGLARDIDDNNIALGRYDTHRDMLEVAKAADEFVRTRRDEALAIVNGLQPETEGLYASDLYTALERVARETNDVDLAMELVNSKVAKDLAKEWGQRIAGFRNFTGDGDFDVVSQLKSLDNKFKKDYDEKGKERVKKATDEFVEELEKADSEQDVDSFLDSVKCQ